MRSIRWDSILRTHCRICETKLTQDDDPVWGLCESCMEVKRALFKKSIGMEDEPEPAPTGMIRYPNRLA